MDYILGSLETRRKQALKKSDLLKAKSVYRFLLLIFFFENFECHIFCMLHFPLECHIDKAQRIFSGMGPLSTIAHSITVCEGSLGATCGPHIDAFGDFRQLDPHEPCLFHVCSDQQVLLLAL